MSVRNHRAPRLVVAAVLAAAVGIASGCDDRSAAPAPSAPVLATPTPPSSASSVAPAPSATAAPRPPWEGADIEPPEEAESDARVGGPAHRSVARAPADDPVLRANPEVLTKHFGGDVPFPLEVQRVGVHGAREAVLVTSARAGVRPLVILADASGAALWTKDRPLAGTRESVKGLTIVAGPEGSVNISWWDEPTKAVAFRRWGFDGSVFADYQLFDADACDALDATYWPGHGWIVTVVMAAEGVARTQLLTESGLGAFGGGVIELTGSEQVESRAVAVPSIDGTIYYAYVGRPRGEAAGTKPSVYATMRRADGTSAWKGPVALGQVDRPSDPRALDPVATLPSAAVLRVQVGQASFEIGSDGRPVAPRPAKR